MVTAKLCNNLPAWAALKRHHRAMGDMHLRDLFARDPGRFERFSLEACGLFLDYSKNRIDGQTLELLRELADQAGLGTWMERMFAGELVNNTEQRAALHVALRHPGSAPFPSAENDVMPEVREVLGRMRRFTESVRDGTWRGYTGKRMRAVVNIGIGGSDLGPAMAAEALARWRHPELSAHFVSNLDATQLERILAGLDPETTLFIVSSKTFTTQETLTNAASARAWLLAHAGEARDVVSRHFVAVSTAYDRTTEFGIDEANVFEFWDWVGGRYSMWSAIGLSLATLIGMEDFSALLAGANEMDVHFRTAPWERNMPIVLGLLSVWYRNFFHADTHAVLPYDYALRRLPDYLQQLEMESNGKRVTRDGVAVGFATCPVIWGGPGDNGQHAFYQLLHQGTALIPADFIIAARSQHPRPEHEEGVIANALAQTEALMRGRSEAEVRAELEGQGLRGDALRAAVPHRVLPGNQPVSTLVYRRLDPRVLGALVALYEHKVFVQGVCWGVNSFDQFGVELGKQLAKKIQPELSSSEPATAHDASTNGLIEYVRKLRK